jgi:hypothetical protein
VPFCRTSDAVKVIEVGGVTGAVALNTGEVRLRDGRIGSGSSCGQLLGSVKVRAMLYAKVVDRPVLKGEALGVLEPLMRKKVSCWDSTLRILERGLRRLGSVLARDDRKVIMTPIAALVTTFALARKSFVSLTGKIVVQAGIIGSIASSRRPSRVALWTSSWAAICVVIFAIDLPSAAGFEKAGSLLRVWSALAKKPDSMPSIKCATLKFLIALALNEVSGGGPLGIPPPASSAVAEERRATGAIAAGCDEAAAVDIIDDSVASGFKYDVRVVVKGESLLYGRRWVGAAEQSAAKRAKTGRRCGLVNIITN